MKHRIGRTILAIVVATSVVMLPATGGFAAGSKAMELTVSESVPDCAHDHDLPNNTTQKRTDGCDSMAGCALKCFTITEVSFSSVSFLPAANTALVHIRTSDNISSRMGSPPFRPPRI